MNARHYHVSGCARVLPSDDETPSEHVPDCARVLLSDEIPGEHVSDCARVYFLMVRPLVNMYLTVKCT